MDPYGMAPMAPGYGMPPMPPGYGMAAPMAPGYPFGPPPYDPWAGYYDPWNPYGMIAPDAPLDSWQAEQVYQSQPSAWSSAYGGA